MLVSELENEISSLERIAKEAKKHIKNVEFHTLTTRKIRGHYRYYLDDMYAGHDKLNTVKTLVEQEYYGKLYNETVRLIVKAKSYKKAYETCNPIAVFKSLSVGKQVLLKPVVEDVESLIEKFDNEDYTGLAFDEDIKSEFYSVKGERVRSKSEKIIADEFCRKGVHYKYEKPILLDVGRGQQRVFYPDFTVIKKSTGKIVYVEHLGMMDNIGYSSNVMAKLAVYEKNGLLLGRDVLILHETSNSPLSTKVMDLYIDEFLI